MQRNISWENPTTYDNGEQIGEEASTLKVHVWKDGAEVYTTLPGVTSWPIEVNRGETNVWELVAEINEKFSQKSAPLSYTEPFPVPMPPVNSLIS